VVEGRESARVGRMSAAKWARLGAAVVAGSLWALVAAGEATAADTKVTGVADGAGEAYPLFDTKGDPHEAGPITLTIGGKATQAYCIDLKHPLKDGGTYQEAAWKSTTIDDKDKLGKVQWILLHSVPTVDAQKVIESPDLSTLAAGVRKERLPLLVYAATQGAIWHFSDGLEVAAREGREYRLVKAVYDKFVKDAESVAEPVATLSITPASATGEIGAKAGPYTVKSSSPATLTVTGGKAVDANGAQLSGPVKDGAKFWLTSNAVGTVTVDASATGTVPTGRVFISVEKPNEHQKIILAGEAATTLTAHAVGTFTTAGPTLPVTGASAIAAAVAGLVLLVGGALMVVFIRRRRIKFTA